MNIGRLNNYNSSPEEAFESLCTQLFQRWLNRMYAAEISYFSVVNGAGGDGGVEAYGVFNDGSIIGLQAKYFLRSINKGQRDQIEKSVRTAIAVRPELSCYIICFPRKRFSKKKGQEGKLIDDEETKLNLLLSQFNTEFPNLVIELWFEDRLLLELAEAGNEGIARYWFDKEEISFDTLDLRFRLAKVGWLNERYVPDLHATGKIATYIEELLYTPAFIDQKRSDILKVRMVVHSACDLILNFSNLNTAAPLINSQLLELRDKLLEYIEVFDELLEDLERQLCPFRIRIPGEVNIWALISDIEQLPKINTLRNLYPKLISVLKEVHQIHLEGYFKDLIQLFSPHNYSILGPVGTGKTHALANVVESCLAEGRPAIIIAAKDAACKSWGNILRGYLDCCNDWSDEEIFTGLEALAVRKSVSQAGGKKTGEKFLNRMCRVLICIDGIDEADDWSAWRTRLLEAQEWIIKMPIIRFMATARSYPPLNMNPCDLPDNDLGQIRIDLPEYGDYVLRDLVPKYLSAYDITFNENSWILDAFENALTLRLFCEINQGRNVSSFSPKPANFTLGALLKIKIDRLEAECLRKFPKKFAEDEQVMLKVLTFSAEEFMVTKQIEREDLRNRIFQQMSGLLDKGTVAQIMLMLADHGFFQVQHIPSEDGISPDKKLYGIGIQSYMEYLLAIKYAALISGSHTKMLPAALLEPTNEYIRTLTAIILFTDHGIFVGKDGYWEAALDMRQIMRLQFAVLKSSPDELIAPQLEYIKTKFLSSYVNRDLVVNEFILPNLHRKQLRLGVDFIHQTLIEFPNTYQRDLFWSGPDYHDYIDNSHLSLYLDSQRIYFFDEYDQTPLLMAWSLSSINNKYRAHCRSELCTWAAYNLEGFVKLLDLVYKCGDPQIQEDLSTVMRGITAKLNKSDPKIRLLVDWILIEIFDNSVIVNITNSVVRYGALSFIQRAHALGMCTEEELFKCSPPYRVSDRLLELNLTAHPLDTAHDGRFPIQDDLGWYVIKKAFEMFLPYKSGGLDEDGKVFIAPYELKYGVKLNQNQFAVAAAIAFIRKLGWNKETGPAWDGNSGWATFEEKYTHLAVHEIQGYLADRVSYNGYGTENRLMDYGKLFHISNPADHDLALRYHYFHKDAHNWFVPEEIAEPLAFDSKATLSQIRNWSSRAFVPDFKKWFYPSKLQLHGSHNCQDDWITLYCSTSFPEVNGIGRARLRMTCVLVDLEEWEDIKSVLEDPNVGVDTGDISPDDLRASISGGVYHSVTDVVLNGKPEDDAAKWISTDHGEFQVCATVAEVHESDGDSDGDILTIPALALRSGLNIQKTDGRGFFNTMDDLVAVNYRNVETTYTRQELTLVNRTSFEQYLSERKLIAVWFAENFRSTISDSGQKAKDDHWQNCTKWVVHSDSFKVIELHNSSHC
ncbi:hypothetical protein GM921_00705 [Pedobacter sp. LMG 31464]|uniref:NACHT domain-containing protein n=1 Tax=Pedobacter planticolens TaxID=2679964 RepID=A0A923DWK1_9SPHI|nr:hypothetical protein [Pedobacter planticolens]MBB2143990.1 hypothetical protein [Pedobacter planticolens]